jgi:tetratricopeptide (TPR) repeat protein
MLQWTSWRKPQDPNAPPLAFSYRRLTSHHVLMLALILLVVTAFADSLAGDFVYDDHRVVQANPLLGHWDRQTLAHIFTRDYWGAYNTSDGEQPNESLYYRPVVHLLEMATYGIAGQNATLWHLVSLILHLVAVLLAFLIADKSFAAVTRMGQERRQLAAACAAGIFAIHPAQSEVVAWISAASTILVAIFVFGAFICYLTYRETGRARYVAAGLLLYAAALLTKETAIGLPMIIAAYELFVVNRTRAFTERVRRALRIVSPFAAVIVTYFVVRHGILHIFFGEVRSLNFPEDVSLTLADNLRTLPALLLGYMKLAVLPYDHSMMYDFSYVRSLSLTSFWLPVGVWFAATASLAYFWRRLPELRVAAIWAVFPLLAHLYTRGFLSEEIMHDRYLYKSMLGFGLLVAALMTRAAQSQWLRLSVKRTAAVALLIVAAFAAATVVQNTYWRNDQALWDRAAIYAPNSRIVHIALGRLAEDSGRLEAAFEEYETALRINADVIDALNNEAFVYARMGDWNKAARNFERIVALTPDKALAHFNLSFAYAVQKNYAGATREQKKAIELDPNNLHNEWRRNLSQLEKLMAKSGGIQDGAALKQ